MPRGRRPLSSASLPAAAPTRSGGCGSAAAPSAGCATSDRAARSGGGTPGPRPGSIPTAATPTSRYAGSTSPISSPTGYVGWPALGALSDHYDDEVAGVGG